MQRMQSGLGALNSRITLRCIQATKSAMITNLQQRMVANYSSFRLSLQLQALHQPELLLQYSRLLLPLHATLGA